MTHVDRLRQQAVAVQSRIGLSKEMISLRQTEGWQRVAEALQDEESRLIEALIGQDFVPELQIEARAGVRVLRFLRMLPDRKIEDLEALDAELRALQARLDEAGKLGLDERMPPGAAEFLETLGPR